MSGLIKPLDTTNATWQFASVAAGTTLAIWTPGTSLRIYLTGLDISTFGNTTGTIAVFFSTSTNTRGKQVAVYTLGASAEINPRFAGLTSTPDVPLNVNSNVTAANITAYGFELP